MTRPIDIGLSLLSNAEPAGIARAHWAEAQGYDSVWLTDGEGKMHALTLAGAVAASTQRIRIGTGIVPVYTHTPAMLAAAAMAVEHLAPGRFTLGLGSSSRAMMERWNGLQFIKPRTRVRETVQVVRRMLAGERVEFQGETLATSGFRLLPTPPRPIPIYIAALRPRMLELAGEVADGVILNLVPLNRMSEVLGHIAAGAQRAGRSLADFDVVCRYNAVVSDDLAAGLEEVRRYIVRYMATPVYNKYIAWCGFAEEAQAFTEAFAKGDRAATSAALSDALVDAVGLVGDEARVQDLLRGYFAAGVNSVIINAIPAGLAESERTFSACHPRNFR